MRKQEERTLIRLLKKVRFPVSPSLFDAWCEVFPVVGVELLVTCDSRNKRRVFLIHRDDRYWKGWHIPGSVLQPNENVAMVIQRIKERELGFPVSPPRFLMWEERTSARGKEVSLLFSSTYQGAVPPARGSFFPLARLPRNTIPEHRLFLRALRRNKLL